MHMHALYIYIYTVNMHNNNGVKTFANASQP